MNKTDLEISEFKLGQIVARRGEAPIIGRVVKITKDLICIEIGNNHEIVTGGTAWFRAATPEDIDEYGDTK